MWSNIDVIRSVNVKIFFELEVICFIPCGRTFFFVSMRLVPKTPKNEVLVAAEPGSTPKVSLQKADVGEN